MDRAASGSQNGPTTHVAGTTFCGNNLAHWRPRPSKSLNEAATNIGSSPKNDLTVTSWIPSTCRTGPSLPRAERLRAASGARPDDVAVIAPLEWIIRRFIVECKGLAARPVLARATKTLIRRALALPIRQPRGQGRLVLRKLAHRRVD